MTSSDPLASFPPEIKALHQLWLASQDFAALDSVVLAIIAFHRPKRASIANPSNLPDSCRLVGDLDYDSLALAEVVFFIEDLYQVSIPNEDLLKLLTIGDLRGYVRTKITVSAA